MERIYLVKLSTKKYFHSYSLFISFVPNQQCCFFMKLYLSNSPRIKIIMSKVGHKKRITEIFRTEDPSLLFFIYRCFQSVTIFEKYIFSFFKQNSIISSVTCLWRVANNITFSAQCRVKIQTYFEIRLMIISFYKGLSQLFTSITKWVGCEKKYFC